MFGLRRCEVKDCPRSYPGSVGAINRKTAEICSGCVARFAARFGVTGRQVYPEGAGTAGGVPPLPAPPGGPEEVF
jgi:hypothetical protein